MTAESLLCGMGKTWRSDLVHRIYRNGWIVDVLVFLDTVRMVSYPPDHGFEQDSLLAGTGYFLGLSVDVESIAERLAFLRDPVLPRNGQLTWRSALNPQMVNQVVPERRGKCLLLVSRVFEPPPFCYDMDEQSSQRVTRRGSLVDNVCSINWDFEELLACSVELCLFVSRKP